jgi:hypothetical protein
MDNILELELKSENKDQLLVALAKQTHKPKSLSCLVLVYFCWVSLAEYQYSALLNCGFQVTPSGLALFQMVGSLSGRTMLMSDTLWMASNVYLSLVLFPMFKL